MTIVCVFGSRVIKFDEHPCSRVCLHLLELLTAQKSGGGVVYSHRVVVFAGCQ